MGSQDGSTFPYDSFIRVNPRKKRKRRDERNATTPCDLLTRVREELETDGGWSLGCKEIFHKALREVCTKPQKVLCLGLGSPSSSRDARAQLALLSFLCVSSDIDSADVSMYDPAFTGPDRQLLQTLGMRCLDHIQGAEHSLDYPTILYMPHCDLRLYETVIRANWTFQGLCNIIFVANRFSEYVDNNAASKLEKESPCLMRLGAWIGLSTLRCLLASHDAPGALVPFLECRPLPTSGAFPSAFNNLSVQYVRVAALSQQGDTLFGWNVQ